MHAVKQQQKNKKKKIEKQLTRISSYDEEPLQRVNVYVDLYSMGNGMQRSSACSVRRRTTLY